PPLDVDSIRNDPRFQVIENVFTGAPSMLLINRQLPPTDDLAVAQAIQFAVNKEICSRIATKNLSPVAWGPLKPTNWGYNPEVETLYRFDPEKAKQLLDAAGWVPGPDGIRVKDGQRATLVNHTKNDPVTMSMLEAIQGMLKAVGLEFEIRSMSIAAAEEQSRQG